MTYQVVVSRPAQRTLRKLDATVARRVEAAIEGLAREPYPRGVTPLRGYPGVFRLRVGDYRVLYEVADSELIVYVLQVAHRRESYRRPPGVS